MEYSFKSVPNERPMTSQGGRPSSPSKKGRDRDGHAPLNINYVPLGLYASFAPTILAAAGLSKLPPVALPSAPMTCPICFLDVAPSSAIT